MNIQMTRILIELEVMSRRGVFWGEYNESAARFAIGAFCRATRWHKRAEFTLFPTCRRI